MTVPVPTIPGPQPVARVLEEHETAHGWSFRLTVDRHAGPTTEHEVTLSWVDHDHWSGGTTPPSRLIERLVGILAGHVADLPSRFDAARARRWVPQFDELLS